MKKNFFFVLAVAALFFPLSVFGEGKISGMVFGDFFWNAKNNNNATEAETGFWIRRGYFTYDHTFNEDFSGRFRLEVTSSDLTRASATMNPFVKEANLTWKPASHAIQGGMIPTPTWVEIVEGHWGYRSVEKTPVDLHRFGSAVDLGVAIKGSFNEERLGYHLMVGNGAGTRSETNGEKKFYGSFHFKPLKELIVQVYGDIEPGNQNNDHYTLFGFSGYTKENWRVGLLFISRIEQLVGGNHRFIEILSGHGAFKVVEKIWGFARVDRMFDPSPTGNQIDYIPFNTTADSTFIVAGVDYEPIKDVHLIPNMETIIYDPVGGVRPGTDLVPRLSFYWKF